MILKEINKQEFDTFAKNYIPSSFYQTSNYASIMASNNYNTCFLGLYDGDSIKAATLIIYKSNVPLRYGYAPRGFLLDYTNVSLLEIFTNELKKYLTKLNIVAVKLSPSIVKTIYDNKYNVININPLYDRIFNNLKMLKYNHLGYNNYFESMQPRYEVNMDLTNNKYDMFLKLEKRFKTKTRSAEDKGVRIYKGDLKDINDLYINSHAKKELEYLKKVVENYSDDEIEIYYAKLEPSIYLKYNQNLYVTQEKKNNRLNEKVMKNKGKSHQTLINKKMMADNILNIYHDNLSKAIKLVSKYPDGLIVSAIVIYKNNNMINIISECYLKELSYLNSKHLLTWKIIEKYGLKEYKYFNLGGIVSNVDKNDKYYGLNSYKLGFGGNIYEYIGDLELVINKTKYVMYKNSAPLFKK